MHRSVNPKISQCPPVQIACITDLNADINARAPHDISPLLASAQKRFIKASYLLLVFLFCAIALFSAGVGFVVLAVLFWGNVPFLLVCIKSVV